MQIYEVFSYSQIFSPKICKFTKKIDANSQKHLQNHKIRLPSLLLHDTQFGVLKQKEFLAEIIKEHLGFDG